MAAPPLRRHLPLRAPAVLGAAYAAPVALCVAVPRSRRRDLAVCALQMYAYLTAYEMPHDEPEVLARRVRVRYPIAIDRLLGFGELPTIRLQRRLAAGGRLGARERALVWTHWLWFFIPHSAIMYVMARRPAAFPRSATQMYAVFDVGAICYWLAPTAPPWYAPATADDKEIRRMMVEYGEAFWREGWGPLYGLLGGNPLAAMPSLHFATSAMAAMLLAETDVVAGSLGAAYAIALGFALVYLGEHYLVDLLAGLALTLAVRRATPALAPFAARFGAAVARLEAIAQESA